ncbi:unnamed protein product [Boreogadus saida]
MRGKHQEGLTRRGSPGRTRRGTHQEGLTRQDQERHTPEAGQDHEGRTRQDTGDPHRTQWQPGVHQRARASGQGSGAAWPPVELLSQSSHPGFRGCQPQHGVGQSHSVV